MKKVSDFNELASRAFLNELSLRKAPGFQDAVAALSQLLHNAYKEGVKDERKRQAKKARAKKPEASARHGLETRGHPDGCRCRCCDPSW